MLCRWEVWDRHGAMKLVSAEPAGDQTQIPAHSLHGHEEASGITKASGQDLIKEDKYC